MGYYRNYDPFISHLLARRQREARVLELYQPCSRTFRTFSPWQQLRVLAGLRVKLIFGLRAPLSLPTSVPAACYTPLSMFHRSGCAQHIYN